MYHSVFLRVMEGIDESTVVNQWKNLLYAVAQHKLWLWCAAVLCLERKFISFSGMTVDMTSLRKHLIASENALQPALKLRELLLVERHSNVLRLQVDIMACELSNMGIRKKCSIMDVVSDFGMLRFMIGLDVKEFCTLFYVSLPFLNDAFPRTPVINDDNLRNEKGTHKL